MRLTYAAGGEPVSVAIADLDADGDADLVTANRLTRDVSVLLGNGDGTFAQHDTYAAGDYACFVAIEDLDGDGEPDLAVANRDSDDVAVLLSHSAPIPGDINGDGCVDHADLGILLSQWGEGCP